VIAPLAAAAAAAAVDGLQDNTADTRVFLYCRVGIQYETDREMLKHADCHQCRIQPPWTPRIQTTDEPHARSSPSVC